MDQNETIQEILGIVTFIKDNAVTREEAVTKDYFEERLANLVTKDDFENRLNQFKADLVTKDYFEKRLTGFESRFDDLVTKDYFEEHLTEFRSDILTHVDGFLVLNHKLDIELVALRAKYERLEDQLRQIVRHLQIKLQ